MTNEERDKMLGEIHERTIRMDEALIQTKIPERVAALERGKAWILGAAAALGFGGGLIGGHK